MSAWRKNPPTHDEWMEAENHGYWWVKFRLMEEEIEVDEDGNLGRWPEAWYTEIVQVMAAYDDFDDMLDGKGARLSATGGMMLDNLDLSDEEQMKDMYWQPVLPPFNDVKDKRPEVD